ncbi:MAG: hypothetical protein ACKVZH_23300 [Blastocatellia bacterium]
MRIMNAPGLWPMLVVLLVGLSFWMWRKLQSQEAIKEFLIEAPQPKVRVLLLALLLLPAIAHAGALAWSLALRPLATDFVFADDAYDLLIARGLEHSYPPLDLSYAGKVLQYHYGLPLLVELIHRMTSLPLHSVLYGLLPGLFKLILIVSILRILRQLFPDWTLNRLLFCGLIAQACVVLDIYNVVWHLLNLFRASGSSIASLNVMPMLKTFTTPVLTDVYGTGGLAVVLVIALLANLDRSNPIFIGCSVFAIYLAKQQVLLPLAVALAAVSLTALVRKRQISILIGLSIGIALVLVSKLVTPFEAGYMLRPSFNDYLIRLSRGPDAP